MAFTDVEKRQLYAEALGIAANLGANASWTEVRDRLARGHPGLTPGEMRTLGEVARDAQASQTIARRLSGNPNTRTPRGSYTTLPYDARVSVPEFEYRVRIQLQGEDAYHLRHGVFIVRSDKPLTWTEIQAMAESQMRATARGDPYYSVRQGSGRATGIGYELITAFRRDV